MIDTGTAIGESIDSGLQTGDNPKGNLLSVFVLDELYSTRA
jgi:hypothetical protein